ncbi:MAG: 16S rRNA (adenine(1518)-N(6)/adenine(1519)-N(6))-dimethyltransferase RsmA [Gemmatimonadales bacterium]
MRAARAPRPRRRLGQHFLADPAILARIADALDPVPGETVLEIGPGRGSLTDVLLGRGVTVIAMEKDRALAAALGVRRAAWGAYQLSVVQGDALQQDWHALVDARVDAPHAARRAPHFKIIGNIPYNITSPLIEKALTPPLPERVVFLVQREVAERIAASPGSKTYGALSVGVQATCRVELLFTVAPGAFRPPPRVRSALLRLTPLAEPLVAGAEVAALRRFVTACFSRRRKQLRNVVPGGGLTAADLEALGFDPTARPETLPPAAFVRLLRGRRQL